MEQLNKLSLNNGIIIGIIGIAIQLITYYAFPSLLGATWFGIAIWVVLLAVYIIFTLDIRKKIGGFWAFKDALRGIFIMSLVANVFAGIFNFIFYKFIEPGAYDKVVGFVTEGLTATYEKMNMTQDQIDKIMEKVTEGLKSQYQPTILDFFKNLVIIVLVGFVMSLIFAAIFKKNPPMFAPTEEAE